jgi:TPR repeat protein
MMRRLRQAALLAVLLPCSAMAQEPVAPAVPPAPNRTAIAPGIVDVETPSTEAAEAISSEIFGPRLPVDEAYGAFQRGYYLTAFERALPRAEKGDAAAQTLIGEIYAQGLGIGQDDEKAAGWYSLASRNGDRLATFALALYYQQGIGVPKDRARAAEGFNSAAHTR